MSYMILVSCFLGILHIKACEIHAICLFGSLLKLFWYGLYDWLVINALSTTSRLQNGRKSHSHVRFLRQALMRAGIQN